MAYKVFSNGNTLPASDLNTYLMNQSVMTFATAAARDAALTSPTEGMLVWLEDSNKYFYHNGTGWGELVSPGAVAGKNVILNSDFSVWQRGTSPTWTANNTTNYQADRWLAISAAGRTTTRQTSGLTGTKYCLRYQRTAGDTNTTALDIYQILSTDDSIQFAGKTVTFSFYARKGANYSAASGTYLGFGIDSGTGTDQNYVFPGFTGGVSVASSTAVLTADWQRITLTGTVPTNSTQLSVKIVSGTLSGTAGAADYFEITGVQLEAGSVATPFSRNASSIQGELAACQRYYYRWTTGGATYLNAGVGTADSSTTCLVDVRFPVTMRTAVSNIEFSSGTWKLYGNGTTNNVASFAGLGSTLLGNQNAMIYPTVASGLTLNHNYVLRAEHSTAYIGFPAEL